MSEATEQQRLLGLNPASLYKDIWKLSWPVMLGTGLHMGFNLADVAWISRLGALQVAIPALAGSVLWLFMSLSEAISIGTVAMISRFEGAGKRGLMSHVVIHSFWLSLAMAAVVGGLGVIFAEPLLLLFTDDLVTLAGAVPYMQITAAGLVFTFATVSISASLNGIGDTKTPMLVMMGTNALNIILDPLFIFGWLGFPALGVQGAAWATFISNAISVVILLFLLFRRRELNVRSLLAPFNFSIVNNILGIGIPACLQSAARSATGTVMFWLVMNGYGPAAGAAFGAGQRIVGLIFVFLSGLSVAATTLIGQILGLGDKSLAMLASRRLIILGIWVQVAIGFAYIVLASPVTRLLLADDPQALASGISYVRIIGIGLMLGASTGVVGGVFKGAGYTMPTFVAGTVANWLIKIPIAMAGSLWLNWPVEAIWWAISLSVVVEWWLLFVWLRRGSWLEREIVVQSA